MNQLWKLKASLMEQLSTHKDLVSGLEAANAPITTADCRSCPDPCNQGHEEYPAKLDVDVHSDLLGTVKPYRRVIVISTGKSDWAKAVTEVDGTLAAHLLGSESRLHALSPSIPKPTSVSVASKSPNGLFSTAESTRISILNGSHSTIAEDDALHTVLVFPDYKVITGVPSTTEGADHLWRNYVEPGVGRAGAAPLDEAQQQQKSYILPYSCIIQICSHKTRDNRCGVAATKLEPEASGWTVHTQLEDPCSWLDDPIESHDPEHRDAHILDRLKALHALKRVLLVKNSHVGGHKFAGNCIVHVPRGSSVWYGRVTPHHVPAIVQQTIIEGKILPPLLRAGADVARPSRQTLYDW